MFGIDDAMLAAMMEGVGTAAAEGAASAAPAMAGTTAAAAEAALPATTMAASEMVPPAVEAGVAASNVPASEISTLPLSQQSISEATAPLAQPQITPGMSEQNLSSFMAENQSPSVMGQAMKPAADFMGQFPSMTDTAENWINGDIGAEMANMGKAPGMGEAPMMPPGMGEAPKPPSQQQDSPLNWDWAGAADKAKSFIKLANSVQEFAGTKQGMEGQKLSQAQGSIRQPGPVVEPTAMASGPVPQTRLVPGPQSMAEMRLRQLRGY